jgi:hypothetical protein
MSTGKCTSGDGVYGVDQVKATVDQVKRRREDLVIGRSRTGDDTRWDRGAGVVDTLLQLGLAVSASKPQVAGLAGLGLKPRGRILGWHMESSERLRRGETSSWRDRGRPVLKSQLGPLCPWRLRGSRNYLRVGLEMCNSPRNKRRRCHNATRQPSLPIVFLSVSRW